MRRAKGLVDISRREFCAYACAALTLPACLDSDRGAIQTGGLTGANGQPIDGSINPPGDGPMMGGDGGVAGSCPTSGFFDAGLASSYTLNQPKQFGSPNYIFVVKDSNGFYAMTTKCPHQHVIINNYDGSVFFCPAHGATFDLNGKVQPGGPTSTSLVHYAMCTISGGHVGVITSTTVSASQRLVA